MEEEKKNREKIIGKEKDETKIVDNENRVIDIDMLLSEKKSDSAVQGINYLLSLNTKCVDREFITKRFEEKAGNVLDENVALEILKVVLEDAIIEINEKDEYIYINTSTGKIDLEKSQEKVKEYGGNSTVSNTMQENVNKYFAKETTEKDDKKEEEKANFAVTKEFIQRKNEEVDSFFSKNKQTEESIKEVNETKVEQKYIGEKLFEEYKKIVGQLVEYQERYVDDFSSTEEIELLEFDTKLRAAMNTPRFEEISNERNEFLRKHKDLEEFINPDTGLIYDEQYNNYINDVEQDNNNLVKAGVIKHIACISKAGFENITEEQRQRAVMDIVAGLSFEETREEVSRFLEKLVPGYKHSDDINNKENRIAIEKAMRYTENLQLQKEGFERLLKASYKTVLEKTKKARNILIEDDLKNVTDAEVEEYMLQNSQEINIEQTIIEKTGTEEDKYFLGSKIQFSIDDNEAFQYIYKKSTIGTWIDSKEEAILKRFKCLQNSKEELEKSKSNSELAGKRLAKVNSEIEKFKKEYPNIDYNSILDENGKLPDNEKRAIQSYTQLRAISKLTKEIIADEEKVNSYDDYKGLSNEDKKAYLLNTIAILNQKNIEYGTISNEKMKDILTKLGNRRLEILNNKGKQFISINDGQEQIDTKAILKEYNKLSSHKFKNYQELLDYCELNKLEYVNEKMQLCVEIDEKGFEKIGKSRITDDERLKKIEKSKLVNWNKRQFYGNIDNMILGNADEETINSLALSEELKEKIRQLNESIQNEDPIIMEFQRLQAEIQEAHGVKQEQFIKQRELFIRNNPDKYDVFLDIADNPKKYNKSLNSYNDAIIAKNVLLTVGTINGLNDEDIKTLIENPKERNKVLLTLIASFEGALEENLSEVFQAIQKICPNMNGMKIKGDATSKLEQMLPLIGEELGIDEYDDNKILKLVYQSKSIMLENENIRRLSNQDVKDMNQALGVIELYNNIDINSIAQNREQRYFNNSSIDYSKSDIENFENLYYKTISKSWIESKDDAEKYRYIYWLKLERDIKDNTNISNKGRQRFYDKLKEIQDSNPKLRREDFLENGEIKEEYLKQFSEYEDMKFTGDLLSNYVLDENVIESPEDFQKLSKNEKFKYLLNSYLGLAEKSDANGTINKIAMRRLEIISTPEKQFINKDENDNIIVDEKLFCEEYSKFAAYEFKDFNELNKMYKNFKASYVIAKLNTYCKDTRAEDFVKLTAENDKDRALQVEEIKAKNYLRRALNTIGKSNLKNPKQKSEQVVNRSIDNSSEQNSKTEARSTNDIYSKPKSYEEIEGFTKTDEIKDNPMESTKYSINTKKRDLSEEEKSVVEVETIKVAEEKISSIPQETKPTLLDRFKNAISNFGKTPDEDNTLNNDGAENQDKLLPVEQKKGLFNIIADKFKSLFVKVEKEEVKQDESKSDNNAEISSFDAQLRVGTENVDIAAAVRKTQENSNNIKQVNLGNVSQEQDDVVFE